MSTLVIILAGIAAGAAGVGLSYLCWIIVRGWVGTDDPAA